MFGTGSIEKINTGLRGEWGRGDVWPPGECEGEVCWLASDWFTSNSNTLGYVTVYKDASTTAHARYSPNGADKGSTCVYTWHNAAMCRGSTVEQHNHMRARTHSQWSPPPGRWHQQCEHASIQPPSPTCVGPPHPASPVSVSPGALSMPRLKRLTCTRPTDR